MRAKSNPEKAKAQVIEFPYDRSVNRFGPTFSIREDGQYWKTVNGSRRAWSSREAAEEALREGRERERSLFDYAASALLLKEEGLAKAEAGAGEPSLNAAVKATIETAELLGEFTSEDVRAMKGDFGMKEPRAWGVVMKRAAKTGYIVATDRYAKSGRASSHDRPMRVWRYVGAK